MKTLSQIRDMLTISKKLVVEASPSKIGEVCANLQAISNHCKHQYDISTRYLEKAEFLNLYTQIDEVIFALRHYGYNHDTVIKFFGLSSTKSNPSEPADPPQPPRPDDHPQPPEPPQPPRPADPPQPPSGGGEWVAEYFAKYAPATVRIQSLFSAGTGYFISEKGYLLTNHHVIRDSNTVEIATYDEKIRGVAQVVASNKDRDVALLEFVSKKKGEKCPYIPLIPDYSALKQGSEVMNIGNGLDFGLAPSCGYVRFSGQEEGQEDLVYSIPTNSGDSGSPIINRQGYCVGIHKARVEKVAGASSTVNGFSLATPASTIKELLNSWTKKHKINL